MKRIFLLLAVLLVAASVMVGCQGDKGMDASKNTIEEYYEDILSGNPRAAVALFSQETIYASSSITDMEEELIARTMLMGGLESYTLVDTLEEDDGFLLYYSAKYKYGSLDESFNVVKEDGEYKILYANLDQEIKSSVFISGFFNAYSKGDYDEAATYFNKDFLEDLTTEGFVKLLDAVESITGEYISYMPMSGDYTYVDTDGMVLLATVQYRLKGELSSMIAQLNLAHQDDELGFSYVNFYPAYCYDVNTTYEQFMVEGNIESLLKLYSDLFYENVDGGQDTWQEILISLRSDMGNPISNNMTSWSLVDVEGTDGNIYSGVNMDVTREYANGTLNERIVVIDVDGLPQIYLHTFSQGEDTVE